MDKIIEVLFNTNHEMPSGWVIVFLLVIAIVVPNLMRWIQSERSRWNHDIPSAPSPSGNPNRAKKKNKKKK